MLAYSLIKTVGWRGIAETTAVPRGTDKQKAEVMHMSEAETQRADWTLQTDEELLVRSQERPAVFSILVDRYQEAFLRKAKYVLQSQEEAEDAVQEALVKIYTKAHTFRVMEGASFKSWGYKILLNECFTVYRKLKKDRATLARLDREIAELIPDRAALLEQERKLTTDYVLSLLSQIPDRLSEVLNLHFVQDKPAREIAYTLGISENAVRTRIHRAKKELKEVCIENQ